MKERIQYQQVIPEAFKLMLNFEEYATTTEIPFGLRELVKMRASQMNGCGY
jgi:alkylhydroperoxidase family enzyme